jgi:hypothetical protein
LASRPTRPKGKLTRSNGRKKGPVRTFIPNLTSVEGQIESLGNRAVWQARAPDQCGLVRRNWACRARRMTKPIVCRWCGEVAERKACDSAERYEENARDNKELSAPA